MAKSKASKKSAKASKGAKKAARRSSKAAKAARTSKRGATAKKAKKRAGTGSAAKKSPTRRPATKQSAKKSSRKTGRTAKQSRAARKASKKSPALAARKTAKTKTAAAPGKRPNLDRERRTVREEDMVPSPPSSLDMDRTASAVRTGRAEYAERLRNHTSTGPAMTGGDVDADWEDAETVGDEAPGGDNPTPDQDIVDEIGKAIGIEYDDDEELQGGDELVERDRHRWELDPASKEDLDEE